MSRMLREINRDIISLARALQQRRRNLERRRSLLIRKTAEPVRGHEIYHSGRGASHRSSVALSKSAGCEPVMLDFDIIVSKSQIKSP
jgi:hypothetical protein